MMQHTKAKTPGEYIAQLEEPRRSEIQQLHDLIITTVPSCTPTMEFGMLGYGRYHYKYASGREGDWFIIGLASQKHYISLYVSYSVADQFRHQLPKADIGKACIRFKHLADVDLLVLREVVKATERHHRG